MKVYTTAAIAEVAGITITSVRSRAKTRGISPVCIRKGLYTLEDAKKILEKKPRNTKSYKGLDAEALKKALQIG